MRHTQISCFVAVLASFAALALAEHFTISLIVSSAHDRVEAHADTDAPAQGVNPRPVLHAKSGEDLTLQFILASNFPHGTKKAITIRYFIASEKSAGTKASADSGKPPLIEGSFVMDFKPDGRVGVRQQLRIDHAGAYVVRVQSENSDSDHEHFAALDLVIE